MPIDTLPSSYPEYEQTSLEEEARVSETKFGDGYRQRAADGLNNIEETWSLVWKNISTSEATTLIEFFRTKGGYTVFNWTPPGESTAKKWTCRKWSKTPYNSEYTTVKASFRREFDLG